MKLLVASRRYFVRLLSGLCEFRHRRRLLFASRRGSAKFVTVIVFLFASCRGCAKFDSSIFSFVYGNLVA
jgi:succinate dehydrogenase flavin-adding protein (antitoxin of CptAB toxin-antitoxin module)